MMRTLNFICLAVTGLVCLGLYNLAEQARVAQVELRATQSAIKREHDAVTVLGAEWARLTQPNRISALAKKHLALMDRPTLRLSSLAQLPTKALPLPQEGQILTAKAIMRTPLQKPRNAVFQVPSAPAPKPATAIAFRTPATAAPKMAAGAPKTATAVAFQTPPAAPAAAKPRTSVAYTIPADSAVAMRLRAVTAATVSIAPLSSVRNVAFTPEAGH